MRLPPRADQRLALAVSAAAVAAAALAGLAIRVARCVETPNFLGGDPAARALIGLRMWRERDLGLSDGIWLPGHLWLLGASQTLLGDSAAGARLPGILLGGLAPWPAWLLGARTVRALLGPTAPGAQVAGAVAALLVALQPLGVAYGTPSYPEPVSTLLVLWGTAALLRGARRGGEGPSVPAGVAFGLAATTRYETWTLLPMLLVSGPGSRRGRLLLAAFAGAPAVIWAVSRASAVLAFNRSEAGFQLAPDLAANALYYPLALVEWTGPALIPLGLFGLALAAREARARPVALAALLPAGFLEVTAVLGLTGPQQRYLAIPAALLCVGCGVAAGWALGWAHGARGGRGSVRAAASVAAGASLALVGAEVGWMRRFEAAWHGHVPAGIEAAASRLRRAWPEASREAGGPVTVFVDPQDWVAPYFTWRAGVPEGHVPVFTAWGEDPALALAVGRAFEVEEPGLWVIRDGGGVERALGLPPHTCGPERRGATRFVCLGRDGEFRLYRAGPAWGTR